MASREEITLPATRPRSRKSLSHVSSSVRDQENMTADVGALAGGKRAAPIERLTKKSRSKSIGPGGLDALKDSSGNRRKSLVSVPFPPPRSILKPTIPPLREIPAHNSARSSSPKKSTPPIRSPEILIDFNIDVPTVTGTGDLPNPFEVSSSAAVGETRVTLRTEEEQQTAARAREEQERKELEKEVNARRDARRKSLANRRVSFAPEATLHTWDVVVEYQDSTTSSNSTNSTRRASSAAGDTVTSAHPQTPDPLGSDASEPPSTPPDQVEEDTVTASPAHQRDLHQKKHRRSSGIPPMNFNNPDDEAFSSSPLSDVSLGDDEEIIEDDGSLSNSESDNDDDGTAMSLDGETTDMSMASVKSAVSDSSGRLDEALRLASQQAGTHSSHRDGEVGVAEDEEVIASFAPFMKPHQNVASLLDQENVNLFSPAFKAVAATDATDGSSDDEMTMDMTHAIGGILSPEDVEDDELSMDVTRVFGGIISNEAPKPASSRRKSMPTNRRQSSRRISSVEDLGDETMDLTMAVGGIQPAQDATVSKDDEDMTMEFTSVIGGVLPQGNAPYRNRRKSSLAPNSLSQNTKSRESLDSSAGDETMDMDMDMDMTLAIGGIMPSITEATTETDETFGMDMTTALGGILMPQLSTGNRTLAKKIMEMETDLGGSPFRAGVIPGSLPKSTAPTQTIASETGSPSIAAFKGRGLRHSTEVRKSTTPSSRLSSTPIKKPVTPSKQLTPKPPRPTTPAKTPPSKNVVMRTSSPKKLFKNELAKSSTPQSSKPQRSTPNKLFQKDKGTGVATPNFILTPQRRISSGVGIDREGLGSPRIAALLDRRQSIGDQARLFVPGQLTATGKGVRFDDPREMEDQIDRERNEEEDRENGRKIMEREADYVEEERDVTLNLREMIQSLTPKKKSLKGRKSLHVGAAKGILGKRPAELDEEEEEEDNDGIKRLKNHQGSPVKNVKLQAPPSKEETTTGRLTRAGRKSMEIAISSTPTALSSPTKGKHTTPHGQARFKDAEANSTLENILPFSEKEPVDEPEVNEESFGDERIQLQDFLNMTSIRFMELTTTKRRHTIAPQATTSKDNKHLESASLQDCVAAGAAIIPMLELFQHACHELKSYISEGRKTVREIENETFEENPPLFREYISAPPDIKVIMDNQLKNVKTHARLLSKGMWYDWRMTLLATLKDGFLKTDEGMAKDEKVLGRQQALLDSALPQLLKQAEQLASEEADLQMSAEELANCDQEDLAEARQRLITVDADVATKKQMIADLCKQLEGKEVELQASAERKEAFLEEIREAEKIREECRGWSATEISALKNKVDAIEEEHGWTITGVSGTTTSMTYKKEIELVFDASSFKSNNSQLKSTSESRIDLWYIAANRERDALPLTPEKEFFLQNIRDHIRGLLQAQTSVKDLLSAVSVAWNKSNAVQDDIRLLTISCPTRITKTSDNSVLIKAMLLIAPLTTKVEVVFDLVCHGGEKGINIEISPSAKVVYGERFNEPKMKEFLLTRCGSDVQEKCQSEKMSWGAAVAELGEKLLARGRK